MGMLKFKSSALPLPSKEYDQQYFFQLVRVLGIYFKQLDSDTPLEAEFFRGLSTELTNPSASYASAVNQTVLGASTPTVVTYDVTDFENLVTLVSPGNSQIRVQYSGVYNFQFSVQLDKDGGGTSKFWIWYRKNGFDAPLSATEAVVVGNNDETFMALNYFVPMNAGDYFELVFASDDPTGRLAYFPVNGFRPAIPSIILTVNFVSKLP
jgi:hypothetical protein